MPRPTRTARADAELAALRARLEEAEQTLDAIRAGHVDALVVQGPAGERVFTLQGADHRYRRLVETMDEGAAIVDADGTVVYCNRRFAAMLGVALGQLVGAALARHVPSAWRPTFDALVGQGARATARAEIEMVTGDGAAVPVHLSATASDDDVGGVCLVATDLTDHKRSLAIVESERLATSILEQATEAIVVCDHRARVIRANRGALRLAGRNPLLRPFASAFPLDGDDPRIAAGAFPGAALRGEVVAGVEAGLAGPDGAATAVLVSAGPLVSADGASLGCVVSMTDITERASLRAREQAALRDSEAANRTKDEFLATVSHELRTPLTAILGWARMLDAGTLPPERRAWAIKTIERNARAQAQIVEDILDVSRIISGKLRVEFRPVDLRQVLGAALETVRPTAEAKGIALGAQLDAGVGPLHGDPDRLQQVAWNLLSNAVKFTPRGGRVSLRMRASGGGAEFEVRDTGIGIAPEFLAHAFDRFRQADSSVSRTHGGLGLGLAIVRQLVDLHGGAVTIESDGVGEGCAVTVRLPLRAEAAEPLARRRSSPDGRDDRPSVDGALADARVLVVDDDPDGRALVALLLELNGAEVTAVASGVEALAAVPTARPDVLVSDLGMPGLDGFELLRQVRRLPAGEGGATPAVAVTAYARAEDRARAMEAGFAGYVSKPVEPAALVAAVAALLPGG